jgi:hypothetical protein
MVLLCPEYRDELSRASVVRYSRPLHGGFYMAISIKRVETCYLRNDKTDRVNTYLVIEKGREFRVTFRTHTHGRSLGLAGATGILYTDSEDNRVHLQAAAPCGACGLNIEDQVVEGLSPAALRGVIKAEQIGDGQEITVPAEEG